MQHCSTDTAFNRKDASGGAEKLNYEWLRKKGNRNKANKQAEEGHGLCKKKNVWKTVPARHLTTLNDVSKRQECMM